MKRKFTSFSLSDYKIFKLQLLIFGIRFSNFCFLDNHEYDFNKSYECIAGAGFVGFITSSENNRLPQLDPFQKDNKDWKFGHLSYDLKNEIEDVSSVNYDGILFPDFHFFVPQIVFIFSKEKVSIGVDESSDAAEIFTEVNAIQIEQTGNYKPELQSRFSKEEYLETVAKIQKHIKRGDCYEICFCQEFFSENALINPVKIYEKLSELSPNPFSAFYKLEDKFLLCASPERFLKKTGNKIISQPIKGTSSRNKSRQKEEKEKIDLLKNEKERAENIMIVDLVRNDLSKICKEGTVNVEELLKVYSFPQVHQIISTVGGILNDGVTFSQIISATFPMGSMTGAPKKRAMELIEDFERTKRGLFSGTVGYINPEGDFDFNVVIRSILYNAGKQYLSVQAGSAITFKSIAEKEFEECNLKIEAMKKVLE